MEELSSAIRKIARETKEKMEDSIEITDPDEIADIYELLCVLARIVNGMPIIQAFGGPGDWGYGTPIGDALSRK